MSEQSAIEIARSEAAQRGYTTERYQVAAEESEGFWAVSFWLPDPEKLGGDGFVVRLNRTTGEFVDIRRFQ